VYKPTQGSGKILGPTVNTILKNMKYLWQILELEKKNQLALHPSSSLYSFIACSLPTFIPNSYSNIYPSLSSLPHYAIMLHPHGHVHRRRGRGGEGGGGGKGGGGGQGRERGREREMGRERGRGRGRRRGREG
jgi:hypothetical protein